MVKKEDMAETGCMELEGETMGKEAEMIGMEVGLSGVQKLPVGQSLITVVKGTLSRALMYVKLVPVLSTNHMSRVGAPYDVLTKPWYSSVLNSSSWLDISVMLTGLSSTRSRSFTKS